MDAGGDLGWASSAQLTELTSIVAAAAVLAASIVADGCADEGAACGKRFLRASTAPLASFLISFSPTALPSLLPARYEGGMAAGDEAVAEEGFDLRLLLV